jgi:hypothetical protein
VRIGPYGGTSKSARQHQAFLETEGGERYLLRLAGGNPLRDARLEALDGRLVQATGELRETIFLAERVEAAGATAKPKKSRRRKPESKG